MIKPAVALASLLWIAGLATSALPENANYRASGIRVGYIGDSILQGNNLAAPDGRSITALANREITWARALYPHFSIDTWVDLADSFRHFTGLNAGLSGDTTAQVRARMNASGSPSPDIMIVSVGINSVTSGVDAASIQADLEAICRFYLQRGIKVILSNIRPVSAAHLPDADPQLLVRSKVNAWIKKFATTIPDVVFWDVAAAYDDGTGRPISGYTVDGLHPSSLGSQHAAFLLVPIMQQLIKPVDQHAGHEAINFFPNGRLAGKRDISGPRVRGQIAYGFMARMLSGGATIIVEAAKRRDPETRRSIQEFSFTLNGGRSVEVFGLIATSFDVSSLAGKWVKARCKLTLQPWDGWRSLHFDTTYMDWRTTDPGTDELVHGIAWNLELETMPFRLPAAPAPIRPLLRVYLHADTATGPGILQVRQFEFFEVDSPLTVRDAGRSEQN
jgi:lysophospholipase L1-like esterase